MISRLIARIHQVLRRVQIRSTVLWNQSKDGQHPFLIQVFIEDSQSSFCGRRGTAAAPRRRTPAAWLHTCEQTRVCWLQLWYVELLCRLLFSLVFPCWLVKFCTGYCEAGGCSGLRIDQWVSKVVLIRPQAGPSGCVCGFVGWYMSGLFWRPVAG